MMLDSIVPKKESKLASKRILKKSSAVPRGPSSFQVKRPNASKITPALSDDTTSSSSSPRGRQFLKTLGSNVESKKRDNPEATSEEETTADLLVPFEASKLKSLSQETMSKSLKKTRNSHQSKDTRGRSSSKSESRDKSTTKSSTSSAPFENMLVLQNDDAGKLGRISVASFGSSNSVKCVKTDSSFSQAPEHSLNLSFTTGQVFLHLDELESQSVRSKSRRSVHYSRSESASKNRSQTVTVPEEHSSGSVSELEECLDESPSKSPLPERHKTEDTERLTATSVHTLDFKDSPSPRICHKEEDVDTKSCTLTDSDSIPEVIEEDPYLDDFESEPEPVLDEKTERSQQQSLVASQKSHSSGRRSLATKVRRNEGKSNCEKRPISPGRGHTKKKPTSPHRKKSVTDVVEKQQSVEVQTAWTGDYVPDFMTPWMNPCNPFTVATHTLVEPRPILKCTVSDKALDELTGYNPVLTALDNMLRQQVSITRDFLATQKQLHEAINIAIRHCVTTDYPTWENTAKILKDRNQ
ncbi:unnamed protein product [Calicophoron daubneyi]|uniref:DUF4614 domain-containing protein n=1 Tax=Calicophoron daubneyi TaxID=300641 RepID=A0AAV2TIS9_CALDB